ncbi:cbb3-type cytochrome oxidase assembly protein CcoS [Luteimonas sp. MC1828]|uniref:cbb3-type cytochrome oxidase assembly protein CcoS n=1 Tax=Luteimonas sp. MC1828 TaxID=2799787 RepID=UPI0018F1CAA3|nr:cbb3-type cytochrome oxidase assembly protein CcoS [Luteimonas sp. MC1828]MBJ7574151.1 cbb3-type cytochrome oxidase assembly protein CcoS [Luteimonas sp. MC1828]
MNVLLFLIPVSLVLLLLAVWAFRWAVRKGQFENLDAAAIDILRDDSNDRALGEDAPRNAQALDADSNGPPGGTDRAD